MRVSALYVGFQGVVARIAGGVLSLATAFMGRRCMSSTRFAK